MLICTYTELPIAWRIQSGGDSETLGIEPLLASARSRGFRPATVAGDKAYVGQPQYERFSAHNCVPIVPLKNIKTKTAEAAVNRLPSFCKHGLLVFKGADYKRRNTKWECPTGECDPKTRKIPGSNFRPLIPRDSERWWKLYRGRSAVEREFGRLKNEYGLAPLRLRGIHRVELHATLTIFTRLAQALARVRAVAVAGP